MKRTERKHLKENELAIFAKGAQRALEERRNQLTYGAAALLVALAAVIGYFAWTGSVQGRAGSLLAEALAVDEARVGPPAAPGSPNPGLSFPTDREKHQTALTKFKVVADQYPNTDAGLFARYRQATTYVALGESKSAVDTYQQVIDHAGDRIYGQMARLGQAEAQALSGQYDPAINTFKDLSTKKDGPLPVDGILMRLAKTYLEAGKTADAQQTFNRLVEEYPESPFTADARRELDTLKKTT